MAIRGMYETVLALAVPFFFLASGYLLGKKLWGAGSAGGKKSDRKTAKTFCAIVSDLEHHLSAHYTDLLGQTGGEPDPSSNLCGERLFDSGPTV